MSKKTKTKKTKEAKPEIELVCQNRKASFQYEVIDSLEVGIVLVGTEVKSARNHKASLDGAYARIQDGEVWLIGSNIDEYKNATIFNHEPKRERKLLMKKEEIAKFAEKSAQKGFTLIPLKFYFKKGRLKVQLATCQGKQAHDKRESLKKRDAEREMKKLN